ncbi:MAG: ATP-dependent Clp protease proteolytic subunit [Christensenellaceae bacterium]|jgi:ATP-dependent protease ClpP protease subunit|nr:ATP-dependent Clp protease proteolytic subunit [Christensenellaceae bacterium]
MNRRAFLNPEEKKEAEGGPSLRETGTQNLDEGPIAAIPIIGQIEGHSVLPPQAKTTKYEHVLPLLLQAEQSEKIKAVLLLLNTVGGDVEAGLAIAEMVASLSKPSASLVLGGSHSIGVPLAVCAGRSFMVPSATMTIHPVRISGMVITARQSFDYMRDMQARVAKFITEHSHISTERLYELLLSRDEMANDVGSILDGKQAVENGIIDEIGGLKEALNHLRGEIQKGEKGA